MSYRKISIIIPVYRYHPYLSQALDSAVCQDFEFPYEIVISAFGADEKAKEICKEYERKYPDKIQSVFTDMNYGVSISRNVGLLKARGDFILFLDSDDEISKNALSVLYKTMSEGDYDIVTGSFYRKQGEKNHFSCSFKGTGKMVVKKFLTSIWTPFAPYCWGRLYRKEILEHNRIRFSPNLPIFEDWVYFATAFYYANKVKFIKDNLYFYRKNEVSAMHSKQDYVSGSIAAMKEIRKFLSVCNPKLEKKCFSRIYPAMKMKLFYASKESEEYYQKGAKDIYKEAMNRLKKIYKEARE